MRNRFLIMLLAALVTVTFAGCGKTVDREAAPQDIPTEAPFSEEPAPQSFRRTTVYYRSDEGFIVPVTKLIPWEEGIARAALSCLISTPVNLSSARELGLETLIPDGTGFELSIIDGNAKVDLKGMPPLCSRETEDAMIRAIVNTLTEFPTVNTVTIVREGSGGALENGALLPVRQSAYALNPEEPELETSAFGEGVTLYFPNSSGRLMVPVTRRMQAGAGLYSTVAALISGAASPRLLNCFPEDTLLLGAALENGVVTVNLSEDFRRAEQTEGMLSLAARTLELTLAERFDFDTLRLQINGVDYIFDDAEPLPEG